MKWAVHSVETTAKLARHAWIETDPVLTVGVRPPRMATDDEQPDVPVRCPECETTTRVALTDLADAIERHNEQLHDGEEIAEVDPEIAEHVADLIAEDLGLL